MDEGKRRAGNAHDRMRALRTLDAGSRREVEGATLEGGAEGGAVFMRNKVSNKTFSSVILEEEIWRLQEDNERKEETIAQLSEREAQLRRSEEDVQTELRRREEEVEELKKEQASLQQKLTGRSWSSQRGDHSIKQNEETTLSSSAPLRPGAGGGVFKLRLRVFIPGGGAEGSFQTGEGKQSSGERDVPAAEPGTVAPPAPSAPDTLLLH